LARAVLLALFVLKSTVGDRGLIFDIGRLPERVLREVAEEGELAGAALNRVTLRSSGPPANPCGRPPWASR